MYRCASKYPEDHTISLKTYLNEFEKMWKEIRDLIVLSSIKFRPNSDLTEVGYIKSDYTDNITESIESIIDNADDILRYKVYKEILSKNEVQKETSNSES